jgi:hypothetical protein
MACLKESLCPNYSCGGKLKGKQMEGGGEVIDSECHGCRVASTIAVITILALPFLVGVGFGLTERFMTQGAGASQIEAGSVYSLRNGGSKLPQ